MTDDEKDRALCEAHCNSAADEYFNARPQLDSDVNRRIFYAGHRKAWIERCEAVRLNAQTVPPGWPTDDDLTVIYKQANGEDVGKPQPLTTARIFKAMRAMLSAAPAAPAAPQPAPTPRKIEIPPPGADALDVAFAEGWNQCCDAYFGGLPPQAPLVVTVFKTNSDTAEAAPQPAQQPLTVPDGFVPQTCPHCNETWLMEAQQPLTDEQCDAIYTALDAWARKADAYEFGLPHAYGGGAKGGREIIRNAISGVKND